jgi:type I thyroxine 5'-deiodinase
VAFYAVYIREAHPNDGWQLPVNIREQVVFASPGGVEERVNLAGLCVRKLGIEFPALVDHFDDSTDKTYFGWPDRMYVIDRDGKVAYKSKPGPFGFKPQLVEETLQRIVPHSGR